jgi:SAM-dependent methyltransferase
MEQFWGDCQKMQIISKSLHLPEGDFRSLLEKLGPSLGFWRAAEIAALREQVYEAPVLDLGCGDGFITSQVLSQVEIGLDPDQAALERAANLGIYQRFEGSAAEAAHIPPGSIATVISNSVLEHIPRLDDTLQAIACTLLPGGRLIFTAPTEVFSLWLLLPGHRYAAMRNRHFVHLNLWSLEEWQNRLNQAGFEIEQVRPYIRRNWVTTWDLLELLQMIQIRNRRIAGIFWQKMPPAWLDKLAHRAAQIDLSAAAPGGGRLIVARKV